MKIKILRKIKRQRESFARPGFTLIELLVGSTVMLIVIVATLALYMRSNKVAVDQNMLAELQHDVRSAMYFISRDLRMAGVGLPFEFSGYYLEGTDNEDQGGGAEVMPDRLVIMGNIEDPLDLKIGDYQGASENVTLEDYSFEQYPYPDDFYLDKIVLVLPNPSSGCSGGRFRQISQVIHSSGGTNEGLGFAPGQAPEFNPPGGLTAEECDPNDFDGGLVTFIDVKEFWLDVTGNHPDLTAGQNGYIGNGQGSILYMTLNGVHYPLAQNVENLQFEYNGDMDDSGQLDGFLPWQEAWTLDIDVVSRIRLIRILILGRTPNPFVSVSGRVPANLFLYERPPLSNMTGSGQPDRHKRFLLESTSNVRNLSMNLYNTGTR